MKHQSRFRSTLTVLSLLVTVTLAQSDPLGSDSWVLEPYLGNRDQFTLEIPGTWTPFDQNPYSSIGVVAFHSQSPFSQAKKDAPDRDVQQQELIKRLSDLATGAAPSFFAERYKAEKGMECAGFSQQAEKKKLKIFTTGLARDKRVKSVGQPEVSKIDFGGCQGLKIRVRAERPGGPNSELLAYTTAVDNLTYDFVLLNDAQFFEQNRPWFERIMTTVKLTGAQ